MTAQILDGKQLAQQIRTELKQKITLTQASPELAVIIVGNDPASEIYVHSKVSERHRALQIIIDSTHQIERLTKTLDQNIIVSVLRHAHLLTAQLDLLFIHIETAILQRSPQHRLRFVR